MADIYEGLKPTTLPLEEYQRLFRKFKKFVIENHPKVKPKDQNRFAMDLMGQGYPRWDKYGNVVAIDDPKGYDRLINGVTMNPDGSMKKGSWKARTGRQKTQNLASKTRNKNLDNQTVGEANFPKAKPGSGIDVHHKHWTALYGEAFKNLKGKELTELKLYAKNILGLDLGDKEANAAFLPSDKIAGLTTENKPHAKIHKFLESPIEPGSKKTYRKFFQEFLGNNPSLDQRKKALSLMKYAVQMPADRELMSYMQDFASKNHSLYRTLYQDQLFDPTKKISSINGAGTNLRKSYNETTQITESLLGNGNGNNNGNGNGLNGRNGNGNGLNGRNGNKTPSIPQEKIHTTDLNGTRTTAFSKVGKVRDVDQLANIGSNIASGNYVGAGVGTATFGTSKALQNKKVQQRIAKQISKLVAERGAKSAAKLVPGLDIALSGKESWDYLRQGRLDQAGIAALSGAIGWVPLIGDGASAALDLTNTGMDIARLQAPTGAKKKKVKKNIQGYERFLKGLDSKAF